MGKRGFFWLGAFGSIGIYLLLLFTLYFTFFVSDSVKKIALKSEQSVIEVSMVEPEGKMPVLPSQVQEAVMQGPNVEKKTEIVPQREPLKEPKKEPKKEMEKPKEVGESIKKTLREVIPKKTIESDNKQSASVPTQNSSSARELVANLSIKKNSDVSFSFNSDGEVNEYLNNIAKLIKQGWNPTKSDVGFWAVVFVRIEPNGSFTYRVKRGSDREFVYRLEDYMEFLKKRGFPPPTNAKGIEVEFNFKVRE